MASTSTLLTLMKSASSTSTTRESVLGPSAYQFCQQCPNLLNYRRVSTASFNKSRGRVNTFYKNLEYSPDYQPNFEFGRKQLGSCGSKFEKVSPRKPFHYTSDSTNENFLDTEKVYKNEKSPFFERSVRTSFLMSLINYHRVNSPVLDRMISREKDPNSPFPTFMQVLSKRGISELTYGTA